MPQAALQSTTKKKLTLAKQEKWKVVDLFSGGGGMSCGFHCHQKFEVVAAADAQVAKPSSGKGTLDCNNTFFANIGVKPLEEDLSVIDPLVLRNKMQNVRPNILIACAPCTGFSRANASNHLRDDPRNSLVARMADFVAAFCPDILVMENARELLRGHFTHHFEFLRERLTALGYQVTAEIHFLDKFGLPQRRERALVIAAHRHFAVHTLEEFWQGWKVRREATTVRRAIAGIPRIKAGEVDPQDRWHVSPNLGETALKRIRAIPRNGGSWIDIINHPNASELLTPAMKRYIEKGDFGSHPDVYGRLCWDRPAVTVKRECGHTGNGRYAHPEQDRLCSVREMAILQGFPNAYRFAGSSLSNMYRHIGDAVPPLISYQIAHVCEWILTGSKPEIQSAIMPDTQLAASDVLSEAHQYRFFTEFCG